MAKMNVKALGLTLGLVWASGLLLLGWLSMCLDWGTGIVDLLGSAYLGYESTLIGTLVGAAWGFCDGFICGVLVAWLYNKLSDKV